MPAIEFPGTEPPPSVLTHGQFFGLPNCEAATPSFVFSRMNVAWSGEELPRHTHENGHFVLVLRGVYVTDASSDLCGPSTLLFNPPGTTHRDRFHSRRGTFLSISVDPECAPVASRALPRPILLREGHALKCATEVCAALRDAQPLDFLLEALGFELLGTAGLASPWPDNRPPSWLLRARDCIRDGCTSALTVAQVAADAGVHPVHLARAFRQYFGCSPGSYLRECRLDIARRLLRTSGLPLADVALSAGYCDQSQFTKTFHRAAHTTPAAFRRRLIS